MAELPEISKLSAQMHDRLPGKVICGLELLQDKCANVSQADFLSRIKGATVEAVFHKGKWILFRLSNEEYILLSLGMGADILYYDREAVLPEKYQVRLTFTDGTGFTARFWWFGKFLLVSSVELPQDPNTKDVALDPFDEHFTLDYFQSLVRGKRTGVKSFLMNQKKVGGIGNMYMHDILFKAGLHPQKKLSDLDETQICRLYESMMEVLRFSAGKGGLAYEKDFYGQGGGYTKEDFLVGYREGLPCPDCGGVIQQLKTGSTSSYICSNCQQL